MLYTLIKNKKASESTSIVALVFLVLVLFSLVLYLFLINPKKISENIVTANFIENIELDKQVSEMYLIQIGEEVFIKLVKEDSPNLEEFALDESFSNRFEESLKQKILAYESDDLKFKAIKESFITDNFNTEINKDSLILNVYGLSFVKKMPETEKYPESEIIYNYNTDVFVEFNLDKLKARNMFN